ncbi:MAG: MBL fold metallo-hydrolase, partial [Candidatus Dormibacteria bacterium]
MNERIVRLLAPNPSPLTLEGTNTYLVCGRGQAIVVDPGPQIPDHLAAIERALAERDLTLAAIAVTHGHPDHAPLGAELAARTGAPLYA